MFFGNGRQAFRFLAGQLLKRSPSQLFVLPAYTCDTVLQALDEAGVEMAFVDIDDSLDFDMPGLQSLLGTNADRAITLVPTSLFGAPLRDYKTLFPHCRVIEDRAQSWFDAHSRADHQIMSFGPGKQVSGMGGGALTGAQELLDQYQTLPQEGGFLQAALTSVASEFLLRGGWALMGERLTKRAAASAQSDWVHAMEPSALGRWRAGWISHSLHGFKTESRSAVAARYHDEIVPARRFRIPRGLPYLRYPVRERLRAPGVSAGDMYEKVWERAQETAKRQLPGAEAVVRASLLPTHERVTAAHQAAYCARVAAA